jgi:hypothetical protein
LRACVATRTTLLRITSAKYNLLVADPKEVPSTAQGSKFISRKKKFVRKVTQPFTITCVPIFQSFLWTFFQQKRNILVKKTQYIACASYKPK